MIFVTVGQRLPFDRMIRAVDEWVGRTGRGDVFAQIGDGAYEPRHCRWVRKLSPQDFSECAGKAEAIVTHAGMGTIITALEKGRPIVVMPRRAALKEQTNDHQLATARHWAQDGRIAVAFDEAELLAVLDRLDELKPADNRTTPEAERLLAAIRAFIAAG